MFQPIFQPRFSSVGKDPKTGKKQKVPRVSSHANSHASLMNMVRQLIKLSKDSHRGHYSQAVGIQATVDELALHDETMEAQLRILQVQVRELLASLRSSREVENRINDQVSALMRFIATCGQIALPTINRLLALQGGVELPRETLDDLVEVVRRSEEEAIPHFGRLPENLSNLLVETEDNLTASQRTARTRANTEIYPEAAARLNDAVPFYTVYNNCPRKKEELDEEDRQFFENANAAAEAEHANDPCDQVIRRDMRSGVSKNPLDEAQSAWNPNYRKYTRDQLSRYTDEELAAMQVAGNEDEENPNEMDVDEEQSTPPTRNTSPESPPKRKEKGSKNQKSKQSMKSERSESVSTSGRQRNDSVNTTAVGRRPAAGRAASTSTPTSTVRPSTEVPKSSRPQPPPPSSSDKKDPKKPKDGQSEPLIDKLKSNLAKLKEETARREKATREKAEKEKLQREINRLKKDLDIANEQANEAKKEAKEARKEKDSNLSKNKPTLKERLGARNAPLRTDNTSRRPEASKKKSSTPAQDRLTRVGPGKLVNLKGKKQLQKDDDNDSNASTNSTKRKREPSVNRASKKSRVSTTSRASNNSVEFLGSSPMTSETRGRMGRRHQRYSPPRQTIRDARDRISPKGTVRDHLQRKKSYSPPDTRVQFDLTNLEEEAEQGDDGYGDEVEEEEEEGSVEDEQEVDQDEDQNDEDLEVNEDYNFDY